MGPSSINGKPVAPQRSPQVISRSAILILSGVLIGNSVLTEIVFNRPGLGKLIVNSLNQRDYTMLEGLMVIYAFIIVIVNLLTDLTYGLIDPRVRQR